MLPVLDSLRLGCILAIIVESLTRVDQVLQVSQLLNVLKISMSVHDVWLKVTTPWFVRQGPRL